MSGGQSQLRSLLQSSVNALTCYVPEQKYFELNLATFLFKLLANLSTKKCPYLLLKILKLSLSIDQLSVSFILLSKSALGVATRGIL